MKFNSLNGQWQMRQCGKEEMHCVTIPGSVYSALLADGTMEDPFYRENEAPAFELLRNDFEFFRTFEAEEELLQMNRVLLRCEGLDTLAHVYLNGQEVGYADNMHITWEWDVKSLLHPGENQLMIHFDSPIEYALAAYDNSPGWYSTDAIPGFAHIRKVHCMYGWDWGPRLPDAGIWRDISLVGVDQARFDSVLVLQHHEENRVTLEIKPELDCAGAAKPMWTAAVTAPDGATYAADANGKVIIDDPRLWWPNGFGEQPLYTVTVTLTCDGVEQDVWQRRIGLRTLTVSRAKTEWGEEFCHVVNGVKIFAMGADYIPEDNIFSRITPERTRRLLEDAKLANFNTVRIWGGGYYPWDCFYDICDELGLLVWQDLMYACAYYDLTPAFEQSIRTETVQNVRRLRHHASLALLCGNNEMESFHVSAIHQKVTTGNAGGFEPDFPHHHADYIKMYEYILSGICETEAPQTFYWPSSPSSGGAFDDPGSPHRGDQHYWDVWHGEKPFTEYRKFLFTYVSEFGFQSFPCLRTVEAFTEPRDRNVFSKVMERHQRNGAANGKIMSYLAQTYRYPKSFDHLLYASQLLQADAMRYGVEHWRRNRGHCMGAIIWQLNDIWPVASWASIDYYGRWKALHYMAKRFFAPVMISAEEHGQLDQNPKINEFHPAPILRSARLNVTNETMQPVTGKVCWALRHADGSVVRSGEETVTVEALSAHWLDELVFDDASLNDHYLSYAFVVDGQTISEGIALFCAPKHFNFADPQLTVRREGDEVVVTASVFAKSVCIESEDADLLLSDNFFDLNACEKRVKILRGHAENLRVRSVYDLD